MNPDQAWDRWYNSPDFPNPAPGEDFSASDMEQAFRVGWDRATVAAAIAAVGPS